MDEKALRERDHLIVFYILVDNENKIFSYTIIDNGATRYAFIDKDYVCYKNLPLYKLEEPRELEVFDERSMTSRDITHVTKVQLKIGQHTKALPLFITKLGHYPIVLENP